MIMAGLDALGGPGRRVHTGPNLGMKPLAPNTPGPQRSPLSTLFSGAWVSVSVAVLALLSACAHPLAPEPATAPAAAPGLPSPALPPTAPSHSAPLDAGPAPLPGWAGGPPDNAWPQLHPRSIWRAQAWSGLPGWLQDELPQALPPLQASCQRPAAAWRAFCAELPQALGLETTELRAWLQARLQAFQVLSPDGQAEGLLTGYFEPELKARRQPNATHTVPIHAPPKTGSPAQATWSRAQLEQDPQAQAALQGRELAFLEDPLDLLLMQIQGSGRVLVEEANGDSRWRRMAFAGHNGHPYRSVGRWLIDQGHLQPGQASWPGIKAWVAQNPQQLTALLHSNPRYVFFREEALNDPGIGPVGAQGVPLTPGRSIAVDPQSVPYGSPVWIASVDPLGGAPLQRLTVAQDTGAAIVGPVRADYFAGWGDMALAQAGRMRHTLQKWVLWPRPPADEVLNSGAP
jgi:membrane-bound lytic murein transglycosylase A